MILGRPTNLWLGFLTAATGFVGLVAASTGHPIDPAILAGAVALEGAGVALVANQSPVVSEGDTVHVQTEAGQPNYTIVATSAPPPVTVPDN